MQRNNKIERFEYSKTRLRGIYSRFGCGVHPISMILSADVGSEVVLALIDDSRPTLSLSSKMALDFFFRSFVIRTAGGPVAVFLFYILDKATNLPIYLYDFAFNPTIVSNFTPWELISCQSHVHLLFVNNDDIVLNSYEYVNNFEFDVAVDVVKKSSAGSFVYWDIASTEYNDKYSALDLLQLS